MKEIPEHLDWVKGRLECSATTIFAELGAMAQADVATKGEKVSAAEKEQGFVPSFKKDHDDYFSVSSGVKTARFLRRGNTIEVSSMTGTKTESSFEVTTVFTASGDCRLQVDGNGEFTKWEVLRKVIEPVLFQPVKE